MNGAAFEERTSGWAAGPPSLQGNARLNRKKLPFPTQSDGRKVRKPGDAKCYKGHGARACGPGGHSLGKKTQPGTAALHPGRHLQGANRSPPCNSQEMRFGDGKRTGRGNWGFISIYKTCFLSPAGYTWMFTACSLFLYRMPEIFHTRFLNKKQDRHKRRGEQTVPKQKDPHRCWPPGQGYPNGR